MALFNARTTTAMEFIPDDEWDTISQRWGLHDLEGISLPSVPTTKDTQGYAPLNEVPCEERVVV
jgi:hypothetical protein